MSLGPGSAGYSPTLDCNNGVIVVGRLSSSVLIIDAGKAKTGWDNWLKYGDEEGGSGAGTNPNEWGMVREPRGVNQQAIIQPFYITDPESDFLPANWGVAIIPNIDQSGSATELDVSVGTLAPGMMFTSSKPVSGMPTYQYTYVPERSQNPRLPYQSEPLFPGINKNIWPGPISKPIVIGESSPIGFGAKKQAAWINANIINKDGTRDVTNLIVGISTMTPLRGAKGNSLVIFGEKSPTSPEQLGVWPDPKISQTGAVEEAPFGNGVAYELANAVPQIDPLTGYCVIQVYKRTAAKGCSWFLLDLNRPSSPRIISNFGSSWKSATQSNGVIYGVSWASLGKGLLSVVSVVPGALSTIQPACSPDPCAALPKTDITKAIDDNPCLPLTELDCEAKKYDTTDPVDEERLTAETKIALAAFRLKIQEKGYVLQVNSAFRPKSYQYHLKEIYMKYHNFRHDDAINCPQLIQTLKNQMLIHKLLTTNLVAPAETAPHATGKCIDISILNGTIDLARDQFDGLADQCGLVRPRKVDDKMHYRLK